MEGERSGREKLRSDSPYASRLSFDAWLISITKVSIEMDTSVFWSFAFNNKTIFLSARIGNERKFPFEREVPTNSLILNTNDLQNSSRIIYKFIANRFNHLKVHWIAENFWRNCRKEKHLFILLFITRTFINWNNWNMENTRLSEGNFHFRVHNTKLHV